MTNTNPDEPAAAVEGRDLRRTYGREGPSRFWRSQRSGTEVTALDGVSVVVNPGEMVVVTGPSGSGKSTLLHLLAGLDTPTSGTVELNGRDLATVSASRRARLRLEQVGIVFQHFHLLPSLSATSNVAVPLVERGWPKRRRLERAEALLEEVGLADRADHRPGQLSGGEQQRVAIARALANDPVLLVGDEPTGEVDTETGARIIELFEGVADDRAVVVASHDQQVVEAADRVIRLVDGQVRE